jgi:hypothetical protein
VRTGPTPTQSATGNEANHNQQTIKPKSYQTERICRERKKDDQQYNKKPSTTTSRGGGG